MRSKHSQRRFVATSFAVLRWLKTPAIVLILCTAAIGQTEPQLPVPDVNSSESKVEAYPLTEATRGILSEWQKRTAGRTDIRVAFDERSAQAIVFAPTAIQSQIQQEMAAKHGSATPSVTPSVSSGPTTYQLRQLPTAEIHTRLEGLLSRQLPITTDPAGEWQTFKVETAPGVGVSVGINNHLRQVRIDGPAAQVAAWRSVVEALDSPVATDKVTKIVNTKSTSHDRVRKALEILRAEGGAVSPDHNTSLLSTIFQKNATTVAAADPATPPAQPGAPGTSPAAEKSTTQIAPSAQSTIDAAKLAEASGLLGPVQVEFVEGLDVIVLRGSERDVQRVTEIIKQIEDLSAVTVPSIEVYPLKNVDSIRIGVLMQQLYAQVLGPRIGTVSITPLGTPNALLLIGRAENVKMAIELIQRLDQPIVPTARFEVFPLKHANATEAKTVIDGFLGQSTTGGTPSGGPAGSSSAGSGTSSSTQLPTLDPRVLVVVDPRTNSLIVSASPRDIAEIAALINRIDTPGAAAELKVFSIANGDAEALAETLRTLFSVPTQSSGSGAGAEGSSGGGIGHSGPVRMQFSVDPRTNSIIAVGSREDLVVVESILLRLDQGDLRERKTYVYRLNNAAAQMVAVALNQWLQTERQAEAQPELALSPFEQIEREVIVVPEGATNSLIVSATPRFFDEVLRVVKELDERPPMVLIQVLIAQVQLNDTDQFGVELGLQDSVLFDRSILTDIQNQSITNTSPNGVQTTTQNIISATGTPGFNFNGGQALGNNVSGSLNPNALSTAGRVGAQGLSNFAVNRLDPALGFSGFVFSASSDAVSVLLRALQEKRRLEVLSRPQLMALDGQQGTVQVGQEVPTVTGVNQTTFGQTNTIVYRNVGLILNLIPRISPDGLVVMQISAEKSQLSPEQGVPIGFSTNGQVLNAPIIDTTRALTTISALSGQTVILGGLIETAKSDIHRQVPIIGDIPLIGSLFRYDSVQESRREVLIILTPQIIFNKADSDLVKQIESSRMSWILSDVINIHGDSGLRSRCDEWYDGEMESIYPNHIPEEGLLPLSRGQQPVCDPSLNPANGLPAGETTIQITPVPETTEPPPMTRQSPDGHQSVNNPYDSQAANYELAPVRYLAPRLELPGSGK